MKQKKLLKKVVPITHTGENAFSVATIWGLWIVSFQTEQKNFSYALVGMNHFCISIEDHVNTAEEREICFFIHGYFVWCAKIVYLLWIAV